MTKGPGPLPEKTRQKIYFSVQSTGLWADFLAWFISSDKVAVAYFSFAILN